MQLRDYCCRDSGSEIDLAEEMEMHFPSAAMREKNSHVTVSVVTLYRTDSIIFTMHLCSFFLFLSLSVSRNAYYRESNKKSHTEVCMELSIKVKITKEVKIKKKIDDKDEGNETRAWLGVIISHCLTKSFPPVKTIKSRFYLYFF